MDRKPILVLGAGSWGTALALVLARNGRETYLWDIASRHVEDMIRDGSNNRYLPGIKFPDCLTPSNDLRDMLEHVSDIIIAVPCEGLREILNRIKPCSTGQYKLCLASKGFEPVSQSLNHLVVNEIIGQVPVAVLSGPSFAKEVANEIPTAVTIASEDDATAKYFAGLFHNELFRIYTHDDIIGVQVGGAVKNVMAIAAGTSDGLGFGANSRAALITRGLAEITRLGVAMGARQETFMGLAGLGDLVLTCTDDQSRNRQFGLALARGEDVESACSRIGQAIEGMKTVRVVHEMAIKFRIEMPISEQIYNVIYEGVTPQAAVRSLLSREQKAEL